MDSARFRKSTFMVMTLVAMNSVAMAQFGHSAGIRAPYNNLYEALESQNVETTLTGEQLTSDWHIISSGEKGMFALFGISRMPQIASFTQGKIVSFGSDKYLVAYYVQGEDVYSIYSPDRYSRSDKGYLFKDSKLSLALLPLTGTQSIYEIKNFDPATDFISSPIARRADSQSNLKQIALAVMQYTQDYDEKFPPMIAPRYTNDIMHPIRHGNSLVDTVQKRLSPYVKSTKIFLHPATKRPYLPNYKISRLSLSQIKNPSQQFLFYEDAPDMDGMRNVAYVDGHVKALNEAEFQHQRTAQGISESGYPSAAKPTKKSTPKPGTY